MTRSGHRSASARGGFTLVELLVTISIIAILAALVTGASVVVMKRQKENLTRSVLSTLDRALDEYYAVTNSPPPYVIEDYDDVPGGDAAYRDDWGNPSGTNDQHSSRPDVAVFIKNVRGHGAVDEILGGIPGRFLFVTADFAGSQEDINRSPSVVDSWAEKTWPSDEPESTDVQRRYPAERQQMIYYVHPLNPVAQGIYGRCVNKRPYFVSAGPDRLYGHPSESVSTAQSRILAEYPDLDPNDKQAHLAKAREDNLYSYEVNRSFKVPNELFGLSQ